MAKQRVHFAQINLTSYMKDSKNKKTNKKHVATTEKKQKTLHIRDC